MKAVIQKVLSASVSVEGKQISRIGEGLLCLIGIGKEDTEMDAVTLCEAILKKRIWQDETGEYWKRSVVEVQGSILSVSQFTLMASTRTGTKPSFHQAMAAEDSGKLYHYFLDKLKSGYIPDKIADGKFQAMMEVSLVNDGPVTLIIDTAESRQGNKVAEVDPKKAQLAEAKAARRREVDERTRANAERKEKSTNEHHA